ncbi:MAG: DMT family transporter [Gemmobacter sp.]|nr:DMT family transporter [Gemmobacter sp.]
MHQLRARFSALPATSRGILLMMLTVFLFTILDATAKYLLQHYGVVQVVWARYAGQTLMVGLLVLPQVPGVFRTRNLGTHVIRSSFQFGATILFFSSLMVIGLAEATAIMDVNPVLVTLGAALFLGEKLGPRRLFGVMAALVGALIIIRPGTGVFSPAALLPLAAAVFYSGYALMTRKLGHNESVWTSLMYTAMVGTVVSSVAVMFSWEPIALMHLPAYLLVGASGALAQLCMIRAFTLAEAGAIAPFSYVGLLFATLWGWLFFAELPDIWTGIGGLVIVAAGLYVWHRETQAARRDRQQ